MNIKQIEDANTIQNQKDSEFTATTLLKSERFKYTKQMWNSCPQYREEVIRSLITAGSITSLSNKTIRDIAYSDL